MNMRTSFIVLLALICGSAAAVGMSRFRTESDPANEENTTPVVVVKNNIARGRMVSADDLQIHPWPRAAVVPGSLTRLEDAVSRAALTALVPGEVVLDAKLAGKDAGRGLAAVIPKGKRAYAIQASRAASNVGGFILPGNKVDVLLNLRASLSGDNSGGSTVTLLQSVEILAVNQALDAPAENHMNVKDLSSVTLLVSPMQAALLDLGQSLGQLTLSLRNPDDRENGQDRPATLDDIRDRYAKQIQALSGAQPALASVSTGPSTIVTYRGAYRGIVNCEGVVRPSPAAPPADKTPSWLRGMKNVLTNK